MVYTLDKTCFKDGKNHLSEMIHPADWRKIRKLHFSEVITYLDENNVLCYQCSCCKQFFKSVDLHDHWVYDDYNYRRLERFDNLCYICHALQHLERIYDINGKFRSTHYRGVLSEQIETGMIVKYHQLTGSDYKSDLSVILEAEQVREHKLASESSVIVNDLALLTLMNRSLWSAHPIELL